MLLTSFTYFWDLCLYCFDEAFPAYFSSVKDSVTYTYSTDYTLLFTVKITLCLSFLILIRGGVPRYRYDFLTKIGWVKFLGYVLVVFLLSIITFFMW